MIIAFERLEALRYAHFLKKDGALIINDWRIDPMPVVIGAAQYPENIIETLGKEHKVYTVNATEEAKKIGNPRVFNLIVLGVAAQHMDFTKEQWYEVIEKTEALRRPLGDYRNRCTWMLVIIYKEVHKRLWQE